MYSIVDERHFVHCTHPHTPTSLTAHPTNGSCQALVYCCQSCRDRDALLHAASGECRLLASPAAAVELGPWIRDASLALRMLWRGPLAPPLSSPDLSLLAGAVGTALLSGARAAARHAFHAVCRRREETEAAAAAGPAAAPLTAASEDEVLAAVLAVATNTLEFGLLHPGSDASSAQQQTPLVLYR